MVLYVHKITFGLNTQKSKLQSSSVTSWNGQNKVTDSQETRITNAKVKKKTTLVWNHFLQQKSEYNLVLQATTWVLMAV